MFLVSFRYYSVAPLSITFGPPLHFVLALCYFSGTGMKVDDEMSVVLLQSASRWLGRQICVVHCWDAHCAHCSASFFRADAFFVGRLTLFPFRSKGHARAQSHLAQHYLTGGGFIERNNTLFIWLGNLHCHHIVITSSHSGARDGLFAWLETPQEGGQGHP